MQGRVTQAHPNGELTVELLGIIGSHFFPCLQAYKLVFHSFLDPRAKRHCHGKFEIIEQDDEEMEEEPEPEYESTVTYHWNQMIEPRLISA